VKKFIFFGSRARGDHLLSSDYDFIIVSDDFKDEPFPCRGIVLFGYWTAEQPFEALCYTIKEFEKKSRQISIVSEALREGIKIELAGDKRPS
jgi:hypothetical protein